MTKNVIIAAELPAKPEWLYTMYLDSALHTAFTGAPATIEARLGGSFRAFDGALTGTMLHLVPQRMIVQTWRSTNWPPDALDSVLVLTFNPTANGCQIDLNHINVAESDFAGVSHGWEKFYWTPWRAYIENAAKN